MVPAVSRGSTCPSTSRPASATGIRGGENATGISMSGSFGTTDTGWPGRGVVPGANPS